MRLTHLGFTALALAPLTACTDDGRGDTSTLSATGLTSLTSATNPTSVTGVSGTSGGESESGEPTTTEGVEPTSTSTGAPLTCEDLGCEAGLVCCGDACVDVQSDPEHCGGCDPCPAPDNAAAVCSEGQCGLGACADGFNNCDGDASNGCEVAGACTCAPGEEVACYTGPAGTQDQGVCKGGVQTCNAEGDGFGPCEGEVLPADAEVCGNAIDDDCNGTIDDDPDADGDGWTVCGGDCCDGVGPLCSNPELVNPGAFEVMGNMVDDDCDANIDNPLAACDAGLLSNTADPLEYAKAIDLCQVTTEDAPLAERKWGVISGAFNRSNGAGAPNPNARSLRNGFGTNIAPKANEFLAVLSTGHAADLSDGNPAYAKFQGGTDLNTDAPVPADWLMLNGNNFPNVQGCPEPQGGATGRDTIQLKLRIRVPTNAQSFSTKIYFFSSEYPEWVCSPYNDFFVALVDSAGAGNPADKNIAVYKDAMDKLFPVGVNLVKTASGLFTQCKNGQMGCGGGAVAGNYGGCVDNAELVGTGFDLLNPAPQFNADPGYCGANNQVGGGTGWLNMAGNVKPGEIMEIRFVLWDTGDEWYDSLVLLDDFQWSLQASEPGVSPG